jgi:hypothetical protein
VELATVEGETAAVMPQPMQLKCVWELRPTRAVLLGTTDPGSVLCRLPKSDGVLNIILGFVVLYYQGEVPASTCASCARGIM